MRPRFLSLSARSGFRGACGIFVELWGRPPAPAARTHGDVVEPLLAILRRMTYKAWCGIFVPAAFLGCAGVDMDGTFAGTGTGYTWNRDLFPESKAFRDWCAINEGVKGTLNLTRPAE